MPTYVFSPESFIEFVKKHLGEDVVVVVSSDVMDVEKAELESHIGEAEHYVIKFAVSDVTCSEPDEFPLYAIVFSPKDELKEKAKKAIR